MRTVYLDTNIYGDFAAGDLPIEEYERLLDAVRRKRLRVIYTMALMDEQAGHALGKHWGKRAAELARSVCVPQGIRYHVHILRDEVLAILGGRRLPSIFMGSGSGDHSEFSQYQQYLVATPKEAEASLKKFVSKAGAEQEEFRLEMKRIKETVEQLMSVSKQEVQKPSWADYRRHDLNEGGTAERLLRRALREAGAAPRRWRTLGRMLSSAPSVAMYVEITIAYSFALYVLGVSTKRSFGKDLQHAIYASRCHAFVTRDRGFRRILLMIPEHRKCAVHDWKSFLETL